MSRLTAASHGMARSAGAVAGYRIVRNATPAVVVAFAVALLGATPAQAEPQWIMGTSEQSTVVNCSSTIIGEPRTEIGVLAITEWLVDSSRLPRVDEVFYVRTNVGAVGTPCADQALMTTEIVLPRGVQLAISPGNPVRCSYYSTETRQDTAVTPEQGCPQTARDGLYGQSLNRTGSLGPFWELSRLLTIEVPVRSSRVLRGLSAPVPSCDRRRQHGQPCPPDEAGDAVQFALRVLDGNADPWLSPYIPLHVEGSAPGQAQRPAQRAAQDQAQRRRSAGRCAKLRGRRRAVCIRRSCARFRGAARRACTRKVTRRR